MGYHGFGLRREDFTTKPKSSFGNIKELYGEKVNLLIRKSGSNTSRNFALEELKDRKRRIHRIKVLALNGVITIGSIFIFLFIINSI